MTAAPPTRPAARSGPDGFILVAVLWILAALATFVSVYSVYVSTTAIGASGRDTALLAHGLATAAVELAAYRLVSEPKDKRPTRGEVVFRMGKASVAAVFQDEAARIDLNAAPRELIAGLFTVLGAKPEAAGDYADRIIAFRSQASGAEAGEAALYQEAGLDYGPRGAPFVHVEEIWRVPGLPPALVGPALAHLTVFSGRADANAGDADPVVRAALRAALPQSAQAAQGDGDTEGPEGLAQTGLPPPATPGGDAVRVTVRMDFDGGGTRGAEAVILIRDFGDDPYRVLAWREDMDVPSPPPPRPRTERR